MLPVLIVALYTMPLLMHLFCSGHACLFLQLQFSARINSADKMFVFADELEIYIKPR